MNQKLSILSGVLLITVLFFAVLYSEPGILKQPETCAICHDEIYNEWKESAHALAWDNPIMQDLRGTGYTTLYNSETSCMHCWSPAGPLEQSDSPANGSEVSSLAERGVQCITCHGSDISSGVNKWSSGIKEAEPFRIAMHMMRFPSAKMKGNQEFLTSMDFCGVCHFHFAELFPKTSFSKKGLTCQDCHMNEIPGTAALNQTNIAESIEGKERKLSHRFIGGKLHHSEYYGLDEMRKEQLKFIYSAMRISILEIDEVTPGKPLEIRVALSNVGSPHKFPDGGPQGKEAWVELILKDKNDNLISHIGEPEHYLRDKDDEKVLRRIYVNSETGEVEKKYHWKILNKNPIRINNSVPPDSTIHQTFTMPVPVKTAYPISVTANLRFKGLMQEHADMFTDKPDFETPALIIASDSRKL